MQKASKTKLKYQKSIISTAENHISIDELLSRLSNLHEEFSSLVQDQVDLKSVDTYCIDLVNRKLLKHKDPGVRAFVACCLSDILRLYAPDAPYTDTQLTEVFKLVLSQFQSLGDSENGYYIQQTYLITRLLEYRSIVLLTDLPTSNKLLEDLFAIFYDDSNNFNPKLFKVIGGILGEVISEFETVSVAVLKLVFNKFLTYNPQNLPKGLGVVSNCGYEISLILCETYASRMNRYFTKYYSEVLYELTNEENKNYDDSREIGRTLEKLHNLLVRVWETVPDLVSSVMGFIYHELCSEKELLRVQATHLVGNLLTIESGINFVTTYQDVFNAWLSKIADISVDVRIEWVEMIPGILSNRDDISEEISKGLSKTFIDSDHRVRKASVLIFEDIPIQIVWKSITNISVYNSLLLLTREKIRDVRELCITTVAKLYSKSLKNIERLSRNKEIWEVIDTIPAVLFELYYINDLNINEQVDKVVFENLLSLEIDDNKRVERLLAVISHFDRKAFSSFFAFNKRQLQISLALTKFVEFSEQLNERSVDSSILADSAAKLPKAIDWLASGLSEKPKAIAALDAIKELNDKRIYYLMKTCVSSNVTFTSWKSSFKELMNKLQDSSLLRKHNIRAASTIIPKDIAKQINILLYRASPIIYNISNISELLSITKNEHLEIKRQLLDDISKVNPTLLKGQVTTLIEIIKSGGNHFSEDDKEIMSMSEALKTLYNIGKTMNDAINFSDSFFFAKLEDFTTDGEPIVSKYATKLISLSPLASDTLKKTKNGILPLDVKKDKNFTSHIVVLSEMFKYFPHVLDENSTDIVSYLIKEVLLSNQVIGDSEEQVDWVDDNTLHSNAFNSLNAKLVSLKLFTNKLRSIAADASKDELTNAFIKKTMKLFFYLIASGGELISENKKEYYPTPSNYQTRLRCCAGLQVLKLAKIPVLNDFIKPVDIIKLINIVEDESLPVRKMFLDQLKDNIANELISIKFLPLIFFTAYEPDGDVKASTKTWINFSFGKESFKKDTFFERALPRLIHAIAHHPDIIEEFTKEDDSYLNVLTTAIDYLMFYFDSIATQENFSLLYYLSERIKNYQDRVVENEDITSDCGKDNSGNDSKMYVIGELSQMILLQFKEKKGWQHSAYPGKLNLPSDLFQPFNTIKEAQASFKTYIPDKFTQKLQNNIKTKVGRMVHTSQTQRQRAQRKLLANEYQGSNKRRKLTGKLTTKNKNKSSSDEDSGDDFDEDGPYKPTTSANSDMLKRRKNTLRARKEIDYKDDDDEE